MDRVNGSECNFGSGPLAQFIGQCLERVKTMPKLTIGVSNVNRSNNGVRYTITRNDDSRIVVGYVEMVNSIWNIRDAYDEPIRVGSAKYLEMQIAVTKYQEWTEK